QAEYSFQRQNNDELQFKKGDIITVTQCEDGGWWEGTLGDMTGWFPSNYVKEYKAPIVSSEGMPDIQANRSVVLEDLLESEKAHVAEIRGLLENFLEPLATSQLLSGDEYAQLMSNFVEIVQTHEELLDSLEDCNDRVGKLFLSKATLMKNVHQAYCAAHPRAIVILDKYKDELEKFMEERGAAKPGLLVLTTGLSKAFRRLDKYSAMLQELERHMESGHPDRGNTQRSVAVYKDIASVCSATRRQKELELQVLTGPVRGWQGQELSTLGDIIHMGSVAVGVDHRDRYFVLFPQTLLILSVSQRMSAFIYEGKLPLTGITVTRLEDTESIKNAFEVSGPLIEKIVAVCQGPSEANKWVDLISAHPGAVRQQNSDEYKRKATSAVNIAQPPPQSLTALDSRGYCTRVSVCAYSLGTSSYQLTFPPSNYPPTSPYMNLTAHFKKLVKDGLIGRNVVKFLLYNECIRNIDRSKVKFRRRHKRLDRLRPDSSYKSEMQDASDQSDDELASSSDGGSSCTQDSFGFVRFQTGKKLTMTTETDYETFIDYGESHDTKPMYDENFKRLKSSISINRDSDGSFVAISRKKDTLEMRDSLPMYSKPVRKVILKTPSRDSVVHVSTARLDIGTKKPDASDGLNFDKCFTEAPCGSDACEDLVNLDDSLIISNALQRRPLVDERHSMPTLFVGNRFNSSDMTEVYIPSYKENAVINKPVKESTPSSVSTTTHSSSMDLPAVVPVPDKMNVELLYNFHAASDFEPTNQIKKDIIRPPSMFDNNDRISLPKETSPFNKHLLNSDKKISPARQSVTNDECMRRSPSIKRCISYQYLKLKYSLPTDSGASKKCACCSSSRCPSPRSSDSGVAGSCTISSPDPPQNTTEPEFLNAVSSALRHSNSSHNFGRFGRMSFAEHEHDSGQFGDISLTKDELNNPLRFENMFELSTSRDTVKRQTRCQSAERSTELKSSNADGNHEAVFKTGLYAHWWKKEKLPNSMLRGLIVSNQKQNRRGHHQGLGTSQPNNVTTPPPPQHKRSQSFNHHLSYNQFQKGFWQITNLRPAPPLRPSASNSNTTSSGALSSYSRKPQPTHEEDALVLRVFEAYCAAYQNTSRNTMHSGSLNSSYIWREASPNNFNMYSTSVSSLNTSYRLENEDMTPTLKQLWVTVRQLQQDMAQAKVQINEEQKPVITIVTWDNNFLTFFIFRTNFYFL
ncbi:Rho guanine nucleotide exchange factor 7, partial [Pseudolycoriella hygida]